MNKQTDLDAQARTMYSIHMTTHRNVILTICRRAQEPCEKKTREVLRGEIQYYMDRARKRDQAPYVALLEELEALEIEAICDRINSLGWKRFKNGRKWEVCGRSWIPNLPA